MSIQVKREYLKAIRVRYKNATKKQKKVILDEFCQVCQYSRKYAIRVLNGRVEPRTTKPGPKVQYGEQVLFYLIEMWRAMGMPCSKKMVAALPLWVSYYQHEGFSKELKELLLKMSAATMDRKLKPYREAPKRGLSTTKGAHSWVKSRIPIELLKGDINCPGHIEADTVSHCGNSASGNFISTLTLTDLFSGWTENRAIWTKDSHTVVKAISDIDHGLPFFMQTFACDNGYEFLNKTLYHHFKSRLRPVKLIRRRPYKKNDAAHVEQKNYTHVRQLFGYERLDEPQMISLMNEIYKAFWNPLLNYFIPTMKLIKKERIGSKIKKVYDLPQTPYQRIMKSQHVLSSTKKRLKFYFEGMNPFTLRYYLDLKVNEFMKLVENNKRILLKQVA